MQTLCAIIFMAMLSTISFAKDYQIKKLTNSGLLEIQLKTGASTDSLVETESLSSILVKRSQTASDSPLLKKAHLKIAVIGDSGCRLKESTKANEYQDCNNPKAWPFPQIMKSLLREKPDLIIHLGDYHYREQCSKGSPCEKMSPQVGYGWKPWELDFFAPAKKALKKVPWILVRGNHEDCDRAYAGYSQLLATTVFPEKCVNYEAPEFIQLKDLLIVNFDSSSISEKIETTEQVNRDWFERLRLVEEEIKKRDVKSVWLVTHKPIYGLVKMGSQAAPTNMNLQKYFESTGLKAKIEMTIAGHIHLSQIVKPKNGPLQFVLGNGGTLLDTFGDFLQTANTDTLGFESVEIKNPGFGYAVFERLPKAITWSMAFKDPQGNITSRCSFDPRSGACTPQKKNEKTSTK